MTYRDKAGLAILVFGGSLLGHAAMLFWADLVASIMIIVGISVFLWPDGDDAKES